MKLTREQVDEMKMQARGKYPNNAIYDKGESIACMTICAFLESFIEPEYRCPLCGKRLVGKNKNGEYVCERYANGCDFTELSYIVKSMACYKDDWNGGKV